MINGPRVSVIIPTYNRAGLIGRTIENIFEQTYKNIELIIVDDGSTDDTPSVLKRYSDRIRIVSQRNAGPAVARNRGAQMARGELIAFQDSDDLWKPEKLARQVQMLQAEPSVPCCLCNVLIRVSDGKPLTAFDYSWIHPDRPEGIWLNVFEVLSTRFVLFNQAAMIRRDAFERLGGFNQDLRYLEDYDLPLRLALEGPWAMINDALVLYSEGTAGSFSQQALRDLIVLKQCELRIFEQLRELTAEYSNQRALRFLERRLKAVRRQLSATRLKDSKSMLGRLAGNVLAGVNHYEAALFRRSPWFPQPVTRPVSAVDAEARELQSA